MITSLGRPITRLLASAAPASSNKTWLKNPTTKVSVLSNGLRVASEETHGETASVGLYIDTGSRYETTENNGVAHFLEHLAFKGTSKRTQIALEKEVEDIGAHLNAYTSREQTAYWAKIFKKDLGQAVDILSDIIQNSTLSQDSIEMEKDTILREMKEIDSQTEEVLFDRLHETAYQGSSLALTILGTAENVKKMKQADLRSYINTHYTANRMVLAAAGGVNHEELCKLAEKHFSSLPKESPSGPIIRPKPLYTGSDVRVFNDDMQLAYFALAVQSVGWAHPDSVGLMVLQSLLGTWTRTTGAGKNVGSAMCRDIATEGTAHSVSAFNTFYHDTGLFGVYASAEPQHLDSLVNTIQNNLVRLCFSVTEEEVARARNSLKAQLVLQLDSSTAIAEDIGRQLLVYGRRLSVAEIFARVDAIDVKQVKRIASRYVYDQDPVLSAIGPVNSLPDYNWLRGGQYWWRV